MALTAHLSTDLPGPEWLRAGRAAAAGRLGAGVPVLPSAEQEAWRYSRISELDLTTFDPAEPSSSAEASPTTLAPLLDAVGARSGLVITVDGVVVQAEVDDNLASRGLLVTGAGGWNGEHIGEVVRATDVFTELNAALAADVVRVDIPAGLVVDHPLVVVHATTAVANRSIFPRLSVRAGQASEATVVECFVSSGDERQLVVPVTELDVDQAANLGYVAVQQLGSAVWQLAAQASRVGRDAHLRSTTVALGGDYARVRTDSHLVGAGATSDLHAVFFGLGSQVHDFRTLQAHEAPKTTSDLLFKGAIGDTARSVYTGLIQVPRGSAGTNAFQTNRNLVLSHGAHADSVPNLEIEESDVRCSHASAVGPVDEDQRYYLESRGVPPLAAERLIVLGFLDEVVAALPMPGLVERLRAAITTKLDTLGSVVEPTDDLGEVGA